MENEVEMGWSAVAPLIILMAVFGWVIVTAIKNR